jgi:hypothetical protein
MTVQTQAGKANIAAGTPAQTHIQGRIMDYDQGTIGVMLGDLAGTVIPILTTTQAPTNPPPGGAGLVVQVVSGVITLWVWDGSAWRSKT